MKHIRVIMVILLLIPAFMSCKDNGEEAFAHGNFESEDVLVSAEATGTIVRFTVSEGDEVKAGQLIGIIDTSQLALQEAQVRASGEAIRSRLVQIDKQIAVNDVNIRNVQKDLVRIRAMHQEGAATDKQLDDMQGKVNLLEAQNEALRSQKNAVYAELTANRAQMNQVRDQIDNCYIKAPIAGTILEKYVRMGELAITGRALYKITDLSTIILRAYIEGDQLSSLKLGQKVEVNYDGPSGDLLHKTGEVSWISSEAEFTPKIIQTREERVNLVYAVKVLVSNDGSLKIGMPGEIASLNP